MRRLVFVVLVLTACRRSHAPLEPVAPPPAPAPSVAAPAQAGQPAPAAPEPEHAPAAESPAPGSPPPAPGERTQPPTEAEIRAQLDAVLPAVKSCVRAQGKLDPPVRMELHVRLEPAGEVSDALIVGLPAAHDCTREAMTKLRVPRWRGSASLLSIPLLTTGEPLVSPVDGGP